MENLTKFDYQSLENEAQKTLVVNRLQELENAPNFDKDQQLYVNVHGDVVYVVTKKLDDEKQTEIIEQFVLS